MPQLSFCAFLCDFWSHRCGRRFFLYSVSKKLLWSVDQHVVLLGISAIASSKDIWRNNFFNCGNFEPNLDDSSVYVWLKPKTRVSEINDWLFFCIVWVFSLKAKIFYSFDRKCFETDQQLRIRKKPCIYARRTKVQCSHYSISRCNFQHQY